MPGWYGNCAPPSMSPCQCPPERESSLAGNHLQNRPTRKIRGCGSASEPDVAVGLALRVGSLRVRGRQRNRKWWWVRSTHRGGAHINRAAWSCCRTTKFEQLAGVTAVVELPWQRTRSAGWRTRLCDRLKVAGLTPEDRSDPCESFSRPIMGEGGTARTRLAVAETVRRVVPRPGTRRVLGRRGVHLPGRGARGDRGLAPGLQLPQAAQLARDARPGRVRRRVDAERAGAGRMTRPGGVERLAPRGTLERLRCPSGGSATFSRVTSTTLSLVVDRHTGSRHSCCRRALDAPRACARAGPSPPR